ncbi:rhomboid family intramembrane serine protease, partial [Propionicimonas sp.]|uniref:rhomboid family intramembrane serine protease n=1 Tax=Propionicimonas sp. TaxID=1955623 RepID=UPI0039E6AE86
GNLDAVNRHFASPEDPWFRIGSIDVSTSVLVAVIGLLSGIMWVASPEIIYGLAYWPGAVVDGEVWRILTWPLANSISVVFTSLMLWYFGTELERLVGRSRMLWLLVGAWAGLTIASTLVSLIPGLSGTVLAGLGLIQLAVLLLWIAEYPNRPFFFGIPAWVFGMAIVAVQALSMIAYRDFGSLLSLVFSLLLVAVMARRFGLLGAYDWIPGRPATRRPAAARTRHVPRSEVRQEMRRLSDREQLDALLDQINANGIQSLTEAQRKELLKLRERLRRN